MNGRPLGVLGPVTMVTTVVRVSDLSASVTWFRERLQIEPLFVSPRDAAEPLASFPLAGAVLTLWELPRGEERAGTDLERTAYVVVVIDGELGPVHDQLAAAGVEVTEVAPGADNERFFSSTPTATDLK